MSRNNRMLWNKMGLSFVLLLVGMLLIIGIAWGRFRSNVQGDQKYTPRVPSQIYLWGEKTEDGFMPLSDVWKVDGGSHEVPFTVTNGIYGTGEQEDLFARNDLNVYLRIAVTEGIADGENLTVELRLKDAEGTFYQATAQKIEEDSPLYNTFGDGWVYVLRNNNGEEPRFTLRGGEISALEATLVYEVKPDTIGYSMMQLQVVAEG